MNRGTIEYILKYPVEYGQDVITSLSFRRPKGKDFRKLDFDKLESGNMGAIMDIMADLSGSAPHVIDEMEAVDIGGAAKVVTDFLFELTASLATPSKS